MSLVAYDASSGEESESDIDNQDVKVAVSQNKPKSLIKAAEKNVTKPCLDIIGNCIAEISPESEDFDLGKMEKRHLNLPLPKNGSDTNTFLNDNRTIHLKLPIPKMSHQINNDIIKEEDDEFLHKKAAKILVEKPPPLKKPPVKITIPSLQQFMDFNVENKKGPTISPSKKSTSLLSMLPQPKNEDSFGKTNLEKSKKPTTSVISLIPDHVKNRMQQTNKKFTKSSAKSLISVSDSEGSDDDENKDFFSLNVTNKLPEVSDSEIKAMVEKKVAEITQASKKIDKIVEPVESNIQNDTIQGIQNSYSVDQQALKALVGASHAKRRKLVEEVQVVDLSSDQVLPNRNEWMRATLAAETTYQPKGVLVDEEPAPGTRKKHQITYLAHQAKANEAELQAMWAANRQNRRATASKYGF